MISREKFQKIEEGILYLFGLSLFLNYEITKALITVIIIVLILRKMLFKEKLNCGNEKIKNFLLFYIIFGTIWNFLGGMSYKPARSFLKMARYIPFLFFMYPIVENKRDTLKKFGICCLVSYLYLFQKVLVQFVSEKYYRVSGIEGINVTSVVASIVGSFTFSFLLNERDILKKIGYLIIYLSSFFVLVATKGRGALVALILMTIVTSGIYIYEKINVKNVLIGLLSILVIGSLSYKQIPQDSIHRFKTTFNTEQTGDNTSNYLRIEMWKSAIWRVKQKPILGYGTKYDPKDMFRVYAENMPETTSTERYFKDILLKSFDDAHSMYLNALVDNGIFILSLIVIWFLIPSYMFFMNIRKIKKKDIFIGTICGLGSFLIQGLFWPIWRKPDQMYFWIFFTILCILSFEEGKEEI